MHDRSVISNDNRHETEGTKITAAGIGVRDDREPAILATLGPGAYSAVVLGVNNSTGRVEPLASAVRMVCNRQAPFAVKEVWI